MKRLITFTICSLAVSGTASAEEFVVSMIGSNYSPSSIAASVGDTIKFVNDDSTDHNVFVANASHALDLGKQEPGSEAMLILRTPGNFEVECVFHGNMELKVEVGS